MALVVIAVPLISVLYERGAFTAVDTAPTALALAIYGAGLPAFVLQKILQPLYFAREDTRTPFRFAIWSMVVNAVIAVGLAPVIGFAAAAVGTTAAAWIMVAQLWWGTRGMGEAARADDRLRARIPRIVVASAVMGLAIWVGAWALSGQLGQAGHRYWALALLCLGGLAVYAAASLVTGAFRPSDLRAGFARQR